MKNHSYRAVVPSNCGVDRSILKMGALDCCGGCCRGSKLPDFLDPADRGFYENSILKYVLSLVCAASALYCLGLTSTSGSIASAQRTMKAMPHEGDDSIYQTEIGGFGFATFCYFTAFCLSLAASIIISPLLTGSEGEYQNMKSAGEYKFPESR